MIRCMLVKWSGITASKSDVFVWQKAPKGTLNPPVFGDLWPFPMMSVVDIPLSMLISLLPNQKTWNYIPLILNIYMFFTSHPPSTSITLGVSSYQVHGSHIRLWRGSSSYNQGYGRVICALESQSRFRWRLSSALPWGQPTSVFHMFFSYTRYAVVVFFHTVSNFRHDWSTQAQPASGNLEVGEGMQALQLGAGPSTVKLFRIDTTCPPVMFANVDPINSFDIIYIYTIYLIYHLVIQHSHLWMGHLYHGYVK